MTSEGIKKAIEASEKLEKELLSLNKKDQWTLTKPTIQNFKITALEHKIRCSAQEHTLMTTPICPHTSHIIYA